MSQRISVQKALAAALADAMEQDPNVFVLGEDVRVALRGVSAGLVDRFGLHRVLDTPISEQAFTGFATGAALRGLRPVVEYQIPALLYVAFEQIVNQAQKFRLMTGGQATVPVTYLVPGSGARRGLAAQHSDQPHTMFVQAGVCTVVPATAADAYGLFLTAIRTDDPVVVFVPSAVLGRRETVEELVPVPLGKGRIHRAGDDLTVVAIGHLVHDALAVAEELADEISIEVFDPRTLLPFDWELLRESVERTGRLLVLDDSNRSAGFAAEVVATAAEEFRMQVPPRRITRADAPIPYGVELELALIPDRAQVIRACREMLEREPA
jgi:acetoin:2,6-dichlorophenolindophenol oxidoreductase subunit beta